MTGIYPKAFIDSSLTELIVKGEHLTVGNAAFQGCSSFNTLEFEGTFLDVGAAAFAGTGIGNTPVQTVTVPAGSTGERTYTAHWHLQNYLDWVNGAYASVPVPDGAVELTSSSGSAVWTGCVAAVGALTFDQVTVQGDVLLILAGNADVQVQSGIIV